MSGRPGTNREKERAGSAPSAAALPWAIVLGVGAVQLGLHAYYALRVRDPRLLVPHVVAWAHDGLVLVAIAAIWTGMARLAWRHAAARRLLDGLLLTVAAASSFLLAVYPRLLADFLAFPVNLFAVDRGSSSFFVAQYLGWRALRGPLVAVAAGALLTLFAVRLRRPRRPRLLVLPALAVAVATLGRSSPQPLAFGLQQTVLSLLSGHTRAVPALARRFVPSRAATPGPPAAESAATQGQNPRFRHVVVAVLEGVEAASFEQELLEAGTGGFAERVRDRSVYFKHYHSANLDSHTSLVSMLTSVFVPYRAYADATIYAGVDAAPSLVRRLRGRDYRTLFVSTYAYQPFVPVPGDWDSVVDGRTIPARSGLVAVGKSKMEMATEDLAALPTIRSFVTGSTRSFVFHELVYGHSPEWARRTGERQLAYYDRFLRLLLDGLEQAGLADDTLLVVVSDHGRREDPARPESYHVPLLVAGHGIEPGTDLAFRSHASFSAIISSFLDGAALPAPEEGLLTVGSSDRWVYGEIRPDGSSQFVDDSRGRVLSSRGTLDPVSLQRRFQQTVDDFSARFPRPTPAQH